jgi:hypothetical protein
MANESKDTEIKCGPLNFRVGDAAGVLWFGVTDREEKHMLSGFVTPAEVRALRDQLAAWLESNPVTDEDEKRFRERQ